MKWNRGKRERGEHRKRRFCGGITMRKSIADSITTTVRDLNKSGLVDDITMKNIEKFLTVTDLGERAARPYKPLNVKHEKSASYL
jgi:hypothetical protein